MATPIKHFSIGTLRLIGAILLVSVVVFFSITRTEVGREAVARQLETQFARSTRGHLAIGRLTGNLARTFTASDVAIFDSRGQLLARVDTVIFRPSWEDLIRRRFGTQRLELRHPVVILPRRNLLDRAEPPDSTAGWADIAPTGADSASQGTPWTFGALRLIVRRGDILRSPAARSRTPVARHVSIDARFEQDRDGFQLDLLSLAVDGVSPALSILQGSAQVLGDSTGYVINRARLVTRESDISMDGMMGRGEDPRFRLNLEAPRLSFSEVSLFHPPLGLHGVGRAEMSISGRPSDLVVSTLEVYGGTSAIRLSGTVSGWPNALALDVGLSTAPLLRKDIRRVLPSLGLPADLVLDSLSGNTLVSGRWDPASKSGEFEVDAQWGGSAGKATFLGALGTAAGRPTHIDGDLELENFDVSRVYSNPLQRTRINAVAGLAVQIMPGTRPAPPLSAIRGRLAVDLSQTQLGPARIPELQLVLNQTDAGGHLTGSLMQSSGTSTVTADWEGSFAAPDTVTGSLVAAGLELGSLMGWTTARTSLFAQVDGRARPGPLGTATLQVRTDSARVRLDSLVTYPQAQAMELTFERREEGILLGISGDVVQGQLTSSRWRDGLAEVAGLWAAAVSRAIDSELQKPYRRANEPPRPPPSALSDGRIARAAQALAGKQLQVSGSLSFPDLAAISVWHPGYASLRGSSAIQIALTATEDTLHGLVVATAPEIALGSIGAFQASSELSVRSGAPMTGASGLGLTFSASADSVTGPVVSLPDPAVHFDFEQRGGRLELHAARGPLVGPIDVSANVRLERDRLRVRLDTLGVAARQLAWTAVPGAVVSLFADAIVVDNLVLNESSKSQGIQLRGALSPVASDTLSIQARAVQLADLTRFAQLTRQLGGSLTADVALTGGLRQLQIESRVHVPAFVLDDRLLGELALSTSILPDTRDIGAHLSLRPAQPDSGMVVSEVTENHVDIDGTFRLPSEEDPGAWNLQADFERADLFFLKYIFNESVDRFTGSAEIDATVTGPFGRPVVDARSMLRNGSFGVPKIGVRFSFEGEVRIDREAIHIDRALLVDQDGGSVVISGPLLFNDYRFFSFDLTGDLDELLVMNRGETLDLPFYGTIRGSGQARMTGPLTNATLRIADGRTREDSEVFIPIVDTAEEGDESFIIFADSTGRIPDLERLIRRPFFLARRASAERQFLDGLDMDLNIAAPRGSLIHLVIDPLLGDVINAQSTGVVQIRRNQGEFAIFGQMEVLGGDYLFTAGEVFVRRFVIQPGGVLSWVGDPVNARLNLTAAYRTRASAAGLNDVNLGGALIPLVVDLRITGQVVSPAVDLGLSIDRSNQNALGNYQGLEARLNQPDRATEYATSVLLTNSFQLTTNSLGAGAGEQLAFNSVSQLVSSQLSRFLDAALPNVDFSFGLQGERAEDLDITYGVALRLLDERLIIRGEGVYQGSSTDNTRANTQGIQGEFVVEVRLSSTVSAQVFFRREGDILQNSDLTNTAGAGLTYQTEFPSWWTAIRRLLGMND